MKKVVKRIIVLMVSVLLLVSTKQYEVYADDAASVTVSGGEVTQGGEIEVTITLAGNKERILMVDLYVEYDPAILEAVEGTYSGGGGGKVRILSDSGNTTYTLKFKALAAGTSAVNVVNEQSIVGTDQTNRITLYTAAGSVTVKGGAAQSKNNNLSSLTVTPGTLSPAFSKDVTTYNITLSQYSDKITVSATAEDAKAKIAVAGNNLSAGKNTTTITVTAENGERKVYTIYTQVPEKKKEEQTVAPPKDIVVEIDGTMYKVNTTFNEKLLPEGYEIQSYKYKNNKIKVGKGISNGKILFYVSNATVAKAEPLFVVYNEQAGTFSKLQMITTGGMSYMVISDVDALNSVEVPEGYVESEYVLNGITYKTWINENDTSAQSFIIYCTNINGETGWYRYDMSEGTMQRAFIEDIKEKETEPQTTEVIETESETAEETIDSNEVKELQKKYDNYVKKTKLALTMMALLLAAVIVIVVVFTVKSFKDSSYSDDSSGHNGQNDDDDDDDDDYIEDLDD